MSARPRPVTATFPPPVETAPGYHPRSHSYSLSAGSSTASLVSVLDHDSYHEESSKSVQFYLLTYFFICLLMISSSCLYMLSSCVVISYCRQDNDDSVGQSESSSPSLRQRGSEPRDSVERSGLVGDVECCREPLSDIKNTTITTTVRRKTVKLDHGRRCSEDTRHVEDCERQHLSAWEQWILKKAKDERSRLEIEMEKHRLFAFHLNVRILCGVPLNDDIYDE